MRFRPVHVGKMEKEGGLRTEEKRRPKHRTSATAYRMRGGNDSSFYRGRKNNLLIYLNQRSERKPGRESGERGKKIATPEYVNSKDQRERGSFALSLSFKVGRETVTGKKRLRQDRRRSNRFLGIAETGGVAHQNMRKRR